MGIITGLSHIHRYSLFIQHFGKAVSQRIYVSETQDDCLRWLHSYLPPVVWVFVSFHLHPWDVPVVISWPPMVDLKHSRAISCRHARASMGSCLNKGIFLLWYLIICNIYIYTYRHISSFPSTCVTVAYIFCPFLIIFGTETLDRRTDKWDL